MPPREGPKRQRSLSGLAFLTGVGGRDYHSARIMEEPRTKLNLGCGKDIRKGFINLDKRGFRGVDAVHDLDTYPYPFDANTFDVIVVRDILEHLEDPNRALGEIWRIGKPHAEVTIRVPHYCSRYVWADLTHKRGFSFSTFDHYDIGKKKGTSLNNETDVKFEVRFEPLMFPGWQALGIKWIATRFPRIYEGFLCHIFQCGGILFTLNVVK